MLRTSVLSNLTGGLCDVVLERTDSQAVLQYLEDESLFIIPLDDQHKWYRYQSFFHELLSIKFRAQMPQERNSLLSRASVWFVDNGDYRTGLMYAIMAENYEGATSLLSKADCENMMFIGEAPSLLEWLSGVQESALKKYPKLSVTYAWCLLVTGSQQQFTPPPGEGKHKGDGNFLLQFRWKEIGGPPLAFAPEEKRANAAKKGKAHLQ